MRAAALAALVLGVSVGADAAVYRGPVWSWASGKTLTFRAVIQPTPEPGVWSGPARCRPVSPGARCIQQFPFVVVQFDPASNNFVGEISAGCAARGYEKPNGTLNGQYACENGDFGGFNLRRMR